MADLQKRDQHLSRRTREQRAYRLVQVGAVTGAGTIVTGMLAVFGVLSWFIPILLAALTGLTVWMFRGATGQR